MTAIKFKCEIFKEPPFTPFRPSGGPQTPVRNALNQKQVSIHFWPAKLGVSLVSVHAVPSCLQQWAVLHFNLSQISSYYNRCIILYWITAMCNLNAKLTLHTNLQRSRTVLLFLRGEQSSCHSSVFIVLSPSPCSSLSFLSLSSLHTTPLSLCVINPPLLSLSFVQVMTVRLWRVFLITPLLLEEPL